MHDAVESFVEVEFCAVAEVKARRVVTRWVDELRDEVTALWDGDEIRVISSVCPHFGGEFVFSPDCREARCKWHDWRFDVPSGRCLSFGVKTRLRRYEFSESEGMIVVRALA